MINNKTCVINAYNRLPIPMVKGNGIFLTDDKGINYLDFSAGTATVSLGHCHPYINDNLVKQINNLCHCSNLFIIPEQERLARRLSELTFPAKVFFCSSGTEAVESAIKFIRYYHHSKGNMYRNRIITLQDGFHGRTFGAISAGGNDLSRKAFKPLLPGFDRIEKNNIEALKNAINDRVAGILLEPLQSEGGVHVLDVEYLREVRRITSEKDILLCFDEVQSGYGRVGKLFYYKAIDVVPDLLISAKAMGNGFPVAACLAKDFVVESMLPGSHGSTYGGNPLSMIVGNAVLDLVLQDGFYNHIFEMGQYLYERLCSLENDFPEIVADVRGKGLLLGMELKVSAQDVLLRCVERGLIINRTANNRVIRFTPPLIVEVQHINYAINILHSIFKELRLHQ